MAHSNNSVITGKFQGKLGNEIVFRNWGGKTIVAKAPGRRTTAPSEEQTKIQDRFLMGSRFAKAIANGADPNLAEAYTAVLKPRQNLYSRALQDFMSAPVVASIHTRLYTGAEGSEIVVRATDDFKVTSVFVEIFSADGSLLEKGYAIADIYDLDWTYTATRENAVLTGTVIRATATDIPENEGILEIVL